MYTRLEVPSYCIASIPSEPKDCLLYAGDGSSRGFHRNLLTEISPELYKTIGTCDRKRSSGVVLPVISSYGLQALYELVYSGQTIIPIKKVKQVCAQLKALKVEITRRDLSHYPDDNDEGYSGGCSGSSGGGGGGGVGGGGNLNDNGGVVAMEGGSGNVGNTGGGRICDKKESSTKHCEDSDVGMDDDDDDDDSDDDEVIQNTVDDDDDDDDEEEDEETKGMNQDTKDIIRITRYIRKILPRASSFQTSPESFECFICFKSLCNSAVWANHLMAQHFYQNFTCPTCGKKFNYFNVFNQHLYKFHGYRTNNPFKESPGRRKSPPKTELSLL